MLTASKLTKRYGNVISADSLDFTIEKGEIVGLLGANGAGKSTTMNMLTGCIPPSSGEVTVFGSNMAEDPIQAKRHIGYLPEIPPLYADMNVNEQLMFVAQLRSLDKNQRKTELDRVCELTNITDMRKRMIKQLSKGYRQRVGMAQAMIGSPQLLILDEPTAGLDPKQILDMRQLILSLKDQHTIIISSHILAEISSVCTRLLIMKNGKLVADSSPEQLGNAHTGGNQLTLRIKGNPQRVRAALETVSGITGLQVEDSPEPGYADALVSLEGDPETRVDSQATSTAGKGTGTDTRESIFFALAAASCPAVMMKPTKPTLEEIFIRLTA
ncbi:MAG: ABC transporter ATP-binding protein [Spirochaetia bacterium]|jgi:ABC-2 type transport system ATP-binding protein|nr:ABC transporter ATP-binding protein [Spirochaetia bacterium]